MQAPAKKFPDIREGSGPIPRCLQCGSGPGSARILPCRPQPLTGKEPLPSAYQNFFHFPQLFFQNPLHFRKECDIIYKSVQWPLSQAAKTSPSHGEGMGSIPVGVTRQTKSESVSQRKRIRFSCIFVSFRAPQNGRRASSACRFAVPVHFPGGLRGAGGPGIFCPAPASSRNAHCGAAGACASGATGRCAARRPSG